MELCRASKRREQGFVGAGQPGLGAEVGDRGEQGGAAPGIEMGGYFIEQQHRCAALEAGQQAAMGENERDEYGFLFARRSLLGGRAAGAEALLAGMLAPPNLGREYGAEFAALYAALAAKHGVLFYPFFLDGVATRPELNQADRIHPNAAGIDIIVGRIFHEAICGEDTKGRDGSEHTKLDKLLCITRHSTLSRLSCRHILAILS